MIQEKLVAQPINENKIYPPSPHEEPNLKQRGDSNILSSFVIEIVPL